MIDYSKVLSGVVKEIKPSGIRKFFDIANTMEDVISLGVGEPDFRTPWQVRSAGIHSLEVGSTRYTSNRGLEALRDEISVYVKRKYGIEYSPANEILVTVGGSEAIDGAVRAITEPGDEIFAFPHVPVLYLLTDRDRATDTAIQWFDVSTDEAVRADIEVLREKKPRVVLICTIDEYVIASHESSFRQGETSGLRDMQDFLNAFVVEEGYECSGKHHLSGGYTMEVWYLP